MTGYPAPPPQSRAVPPSRLTDIHSVRRSELDTHYSPTVVAVWVGGLLFAAVALFVTGHYFYGIVALALGVLPLIYAER
jgi:hypothetical protein